MPDSTDDDPIADAILSSDPELRARYEGWAMMGKYRLPTKLRAVAAMCGLTAVAVFGIVTVRRNALASVLHGPPLQASVSSSAVLGAGLQFVTIGTAGLLLVGVRRARDGDLSADQIERLVGAEETAALMTFGTGGLGVLIGLATLVALATADPSGAPGWIANFATPLELPLPYGVLGWWAATLSGVALGGSVVFDEAL
jgi:hypothetical protein